MSRAGRSTQSRRKKTTRQSAAAAERYHHGDLPAALLEAAESVLAEKGIDRFTLRECARRAGVSHAAPAHHFGDVTGLLTAMAAVGFDRLTESMQAHRAGAPPDPKSQFLASGLGYVDFAVKNPQHFALMGRKETLDQSNSKLSDAGSAAFGELLTVVAGLHGIDEPMADEAARRDVLSAWSVVHGYASLLLQGRLARFGPLDADEITATLERLFFGLAGVTPADRHSR